MLYYLSIVPQAGDEAFSIWAFGDIKIQTITVRLRKNKFESFWVAEYMEISRA
jgi:hypothetical protein